MKKLFFLLPLLFFGCKDEVEQIPAYLKIEPFIVNAEGGAGWHELSEGWLYVDGEFLGAYTLPATVPVLAEGDVDIIVFPGVKENGVTSTPNIYPFLSRFELTKALKPGETTTIQPQTAYDPAAVFPWAFNRTSFDGGSTIGIENRDGDPDNSFQITTSGAFAGNSLVMTVDTSHFLMQIATEATALPATFENQVWMELHYACDMPFSLILIGQSGGLSEIPQPVYAFGSTDGEWNKIYLNLTEFLISLNQEQYRLYFVANLPTDDSGNYSQLNGAVRLDNIRLAHF
ncbi:MAG: hypothetical protein IT259_05820 [Saprospiraceae bacterium]|nr:hypothetical protein [Saprospiraceae bacterium]